MCGVGFAASHTGCCFSPLIIEGSTEAEPGCQSCLPRTQTQCFFSGTTRELSRVHVWCTYRGGDAPLGTGAKRKKRVLKNKTRSFNRKQNHTQKTLLHTSRMKLKVQGDFGELILKLASTSAPPSGKEKSGVLFHFLLLRWWYDSFPPRISFPAEEVFLCLLLFLLTRSVSRSRERALQLQ